ncbi:MAG: hypothetical protein DCC75_12545 [Proteobacteria bacterium]|nr:MAG: hypothetical protein DCC75_12545 [Pseudomonadota bacterium]
MPTPKKPNPRSPLGAKIALVQTTDKEIVRAVADPKFIDLSRGTFISGRIISPERGHFDDGKDVLINLRHVIAITGFDSVEELYKQRKPAELKAFKGRNGHSI